MSYYDSDFETRQTNNAQNPIPTILAIVFIAIAGYVYSFIKSPEYAFYSFIVSAKHNNYEKASQYINIEKIVNNRVDFLMSEVKNSPTLKNNPFSQYTLMLIDKLKPEMVTALQEGLKAKILDKDNGLQNISEPGLLLFLIIKKSDKITMEKVENTSQTAKFKLEYTDKSQYMDITLNKNDKNKWEITDIWGNYFWDDTQYKKLKRF